MDVPPHEAPPEDMQNPNAPETRRGGNTAATKSKQHACGPTGYVFKPSRDNHNAIQRTHRKALSPTVPRLDEQMLTRLKVSIEQKGSQICGNMEPYSQGQCESPRVEPNEPKP